jgi:hypothetical protein
MQALGVDLAWADAEGANETGVVALDHDGHISSAGWAVGVDQTLAWIVEHAHEAPS